MSDIQAIDLLGRKVVMKNGRSFSRYLEEVRHAIQEARGHSGLKMFAAELEAAIKSLEEVTFHLIITAQVKVAAVMLAEAWFVG